MKAGSSICVWCKERPVVMTALCRRCYTKKINRRVLDRLEVAFKPLTENNKFIFTKYLESTRERLVTDADVALAGKFSLHLSLYAVKPLISWAAVLETSKSVGLHYVRNPPTGCPILQVGRKLQSLGLIPKLTDEKILERSHTFKALQEPLRSWVQEYFADITNTQPACYGLASIAIIRRWADFLSDKSFADSNEEDAQKFIALLPAHGLEQAGNLIRRMKAFYQWLIARSYININPFRSLEYPKVRRLCSKCKKQRSFLHQGDICGHCSSHARYLKELKTVEVQCGALPEYSRDIFKLFLKHVRRLHVQVSHKNEAWLFLKFLQSKNEITHLKSWSAVEAMSLELASFAKASAPKLRRRGCAFLKAGVILQELGVLPIREEVYDLGVERRFVGLEKNVLAAFVRYAAMMREKRRNEKSVLAVISALRSLHDWLLLYPKVDLWSASEQMARDYLVFLGGGKMRIRQPLDRFYRWAKLERYALANPFENIVIGTPRYSLKVCSPEQVAHLEKFVRSVRSNPESAMILMLIFYFGLKIKEMAYATIEFEDQNIKIILHRTRLTYGNSRYNRDQVLVLPSGPPWLAALQKRFRSQWQEKFKIIRSDLPRQPLILDPRARHNRPMVTLSVRKIYYKSINAAVGLRVPPNVLRRAGADLFSQQGATGSLQCMGWYKAYAFNFTWMPRQFFRS